MKKKSDKREATAIEIFDEKTGAYQKVDTVGPITFDSSTNTLEFKVKKVSVKSDFLALLSELEVHKKATAALRAQATGIKPFVEQLIVDIRRIDGEKQRLSYSVVEPDSPEHETIFPVDQLIINERTGLQNELAEEGGEPYRVERIKNRLAEIQKLLADTAEEYRAKQPEIITSIVDRAIGSNAFYVAYWCTVSEITLDQYFRKQKRSEQPEKPKLIESTGKFYRKAGHLEDQSLLYSKPEKESMPLFDQLAPGLQKKISESGVDKAEFNRVGLGIKLEPSEQKLVDCLCQMLHEKSQNRKPGRDDYYTGNEPSGRVKYGGLDASNNQRWATTPTMSFTLYELTKLYRGGEISGGRDVKHVQDILISLAKKNYPIRYERQIVLANKNRQIDSIQTWQPLYELAELKQQTKDERGRLIDEGQLRYGVRLNPIFRDQIDTKFVEYPTDINRRTIAAYGSHNVSKCTYQLRNYLMRERSSGRFEPEIYLDKLYWQLCETWMREGRKKKVGDYTVKAIETVKQLGLLVNHDVVPGATGAPKVIFYLNKEWQ